MKTITATASDLLEALELQQQLESDIGELISVIVPCENCNEWRLVNRDEDKISTTIGEVRGMNYHGGLAHYVCRCGEPFDLFID